MGFEIKKPVEAKEFTRQYISYGVKLLKINNIELKESKSSEKIQHIFHVETPAIGGKFEGAELEDGTKAKGLVGKVKLGLYFDHNSDEAYDTKQRNEFLQALALITEKAGKFEEFEKAANKASSWEDLLKSFKELIKDEFFWFVIAGEEYKKGKYALSFAQVPLEKDINGKWSFGLIVKNKDFHKKKGSKLIRDEQGNLVEVHGTTVMGDNAGKKAVIKFNPEYHLTPYEESDDDLGLENELEGAITEDTNDLPF